MPITPARRTYSNMHIFDREWVEENAVDLVRRAG
jgi:hypothetical protein